MTGILTDQADDFSYGTLYESPFVLILPFVQSIHFYFIYYILNDTKTSIVLISELILMKTIVKQNPDDENSLFFTQSDRSYVM